MITVFFNEDGYYVTGEGVEVARRCSPALTTRGDRIFQPMHHAYKVLFLALCEIRDMSVVHDVMVYNDSRIVDEINGHVEPLDDTCGAWLKTLRRDTIPSVTALVFFRKKPTNHVNATIALAHERMITTISHEAKQELALRETKIRIATEKERKRKAIERLRLSWFGEKTDG